jgi:hypothetical protein
MKRFLPILFMMLATVSCKRDKEAKDDDVNSMEEAQAQRELYCEKSLDDYLAKGYVHGKCDGLTFTALYALACPENDVDILVFESKEEPGRWYRDPKHECAPNGGGSNGTMSNDGILMLALWAVHHNERDLVARTLKYIEDHDSTVGECEEEKKDICQAWPTLVKTLEDWLDGVSLQRGANLLDSFADVKGFRAHLAVNHMLLNGMVYGAINDIEYSILKGQAEREPRNAIYLAAFSLYEDGNQADALKALDDVKHFPKEALPNNHENHCTEYLYQRDEDEGDSDGDWVPCPERDLEIFSGADFGYAVAIAKGEIKK